ncbi:expressed unknown protein [Seminavis robusta]|uniref:Uncharacterized protein n=1 Tax=Seminavis robusta TaxID=568900 RepID=A0A9N8HL03_9STRA|nr:expressed unknown protein [Seminavis robusta]|eukprot:Sro772_g200270.1 n/a (146) ;mRNA; r:23811-24248
MFNTSVEVEANHSVEATLRNFSNSLSALIMGPNHDEDDGVVSWSDSPKPQQDTQHSPVFEAVRQGLSYNDQDLERIAKDPEAFRRLQRALRKKGCITNGYLKQNLQHYVYHLKYEHAIQEARKIETTSSSSRRKPTQSVEVNAAA